MTGAEIFHRKMIHKNEKIMTKEELTELIVLALLRGTSTLSGVSTLDEPGVIGIETEFGDLFFLEVREA